MSFSTGVTVELFVVMTTRYSKYRPRSGLLLEPLAHRREIEGPEVRPPNGVARRISKRLAGVGWIDDTRLVEPVRNRLLARRRIHHLTTEPYRPRTNGKVERFHQTMAREWAHGVTYQSHRHRTQALPHWLDHYNRRRPHSSLGGRPPISRVHNVCG